VVIPVRDGAGYLPLALPPLFSSLPANGEILVCDDGSSDGSGSVAATLGAKVVGSESRGPAAARNHGVRLAVGDTLVFLDADVRVAHDTLERLLKPLEDPRVAATFGSYDDAPGGGWISLYKNLAHHFVHQRSRQEASTFWAGCGAIRREVFESMSGFDEAYARPSIEDVELGYRLCAAGFQVRLVREAQVRHLKRWTLSSWLVSDLRDRAIPWSRLARARGLPRDLNFTFHDRLAVFLVGVTVLGLLASPFRPALAFVAFGGFCSALLLDGPFLRFAARRVSLGFAGMAAVLHLLHRAVAGLGFLIGLFTKGPPTCLPRAVTPKIESAKPDGGPSMEVTQ